MKKRGGPEWEELQRIGQWGYEARRAGGRAFAKPDPNLHRSNAAQGQPQDQLEQDQLIAAFSQDPLSAESSCTDALKTLAIIAADEDAEAAMRAERAARELTSEKRRQAKAERERRQDLWDRMERLNTQKQSVPSSNLFRECTHRPSFRNSVVLQDVEMPITSLLDQVLRRSDKTLISNVMHWWAQDSAFIQHDACPKLPTKSPPVNTECYNANTCLCDAKGKVTKDCLKQWQSTISKGLEKKAGPLRRYYDDGTLIIEFYSDTCESTSVNTAWLNLTTMRGSFHHLIENQSESRQRAAIAKGHRCLQVADEIGECGFKLVTQTFRDMDLSRAWSIRAWRLVVSAGHSGGTARGVGAQHARRAQRGTSPQAAADVEHTCSQSAGCTAGCQGHTPSCTATLECTRGSSSIDARQRGRPR